MTRLTSLLLAGTALGATTAQAQEITYWMWDAQQAPVYRQCADAFEARNPGITVRITQDGWDNYWTTLTTGFISGTAPDVFVNHVSRYPEFLANELMVDLAPLIARDGYDMSGFVEGLAEVWERDGAQWGMPKDWDTVAIFYNKAMAEAAGLTPEDMASLTWNPADGGSFEDAIARLTVDASGTRGDEEGFDPRRVSTFGYVTQPWDGFGQVQWSFLAVANGFQYIDAPWGATYKLDDSALVETVTWFRDLAWEKGLMPTRAQTGQLGGGTLLVSERGAMTVDGSWMIRWYQDNAPFEVGFAPVPAGPAGRKSMFNGLADSIWAGSRNQEAAWEWVKFLGSSECQMIVGESGVVFPARPEAVEAAIATHEANGVDVSAFTDLATPETTFPFPMTDYGSEVLSILVPALDRVLLNQGEPAEILKSANDQINRLF